MKALILAGGRNQRVRPAGWSMPKPLVPVANRPVVAHLLDLLQEAGITQVGVVVDNREGPLCHWPGWRRRPGMKFHFLEQSLPLGSAHAVKVAQGYVGEGPFLAVAGDCLLHGDGGLSGFLRRYEAARPAAAALLARTASPGDFGVAEVGGNRILRLTEKPQRPAGEEVLVGAYVLDERVFAAIDVIRPSPRNELELTAALQHLIDRGLEVHGYPFRGFWRDAGRPEAILEANFHWLDGLKPEVRGEVNRSSVEGRVSVGERARVVNSAVFGPAILGDGCYVVNSWIGPYTVIGNHAVIEDSEVERSVVMAHCRIRGLARLEGSLLGEGNRVGPRAARPLAYRLTLGEGNEIEVP